MATMEIMLTVSSWDKLAGTATIPAYVDPWDPCFTISFRESAQPGLAQRVVLPENRRKDKKENGRMTQSSAFFLSGLFG